MYAGGIHGQLLEINVVGCKNLKDKEWLSRQDPYVIIEYASNKFRTKTDTDGGKNPSFNEKFTLPLIEGLREFTVQVWNSNSLSLDDLIGTTRVPFERVLTSGYDDNSWTLNSKSGKHAGEVKLILHYSQAKQSDKKSKTGYPPAMSGYPPQQGGYPSAPGGYPPAPGGYPPAPGGYPSAPGGYPPAPGGYPPAPGGYPPQQHGYPPQQQHGYPPQQPQHGYPPVPPSGGYGYPPAPGGHGGYPPSAPHGGYGDSSSKIPHASHAPPVHAPIPAGYPAVHAPQKHGDMHGGYGHAPAMVHGGGHHMPAMGHGGQYSHGKQGHYGHGKHKHKKQKGGWKGFKKVFKVYFNALGFLNSVFRDAVI